MTDKFKVLLNPTFLITIIAADICTYLVCCFFFKSFPFFCSRVPLLGWLHSLAGSFGVTLMSAIPEGFQARILTLPAQAAREDREGMHRCSRARHYVTCSPKEGDRGILYVVIIVCSPTRSSGKECRATGGICL